MTNSISSTVHPSFGTFVGMASAMAVEIVAAAGADWVLLDLEHGGGTEADLGPTITAAARQGIPMYVRVESDTRIRIGRALDAGAMGVMVPRIESLEQVKQVVSYMDYPPTGQRGVATYNRSVEWGGRPEVLSAPRSAQCIIQIETLPALEAVESIAAVDGIDVLFIGPLDLSFALGVPRQFDSPRFQAAIARVVSAAKQNGKTAGILAADRMTALKYAAAGFDFIAIGSDSTLLANAAREVFAELSKKGQNS